MDGSTGRNSEKVRGAPLSSFFMKKTFSLLVGAALLFASCSKAVSDPVNPVPVIGDGTGKFSFRMDTAAYRTDSLIVSYRSRDGQTKTQTISGQNSWDSPDLVFKTGDSIRADVKAFGVVLKNNPGAPEGLAFEVYPSFVAVPPVKNTAGTSSTPVTGNRFQHNSSLYYTY